VFQLLLGHVHYPHFVYLEGKNVHYRNRVHWHHVYDIDLRLLWRVAHFFKPVLISFDQTQRWVPHLFGFGKGGNEEYGNTVF